MLKTKDPISSIQLGKAKVAVEFLSEALGVHEREIVEILSYGIAANMGNKVPIKCKYLIDKLKVSVDSY